MGMMMFYLVWSLTIFIDLNTFIFFSLLTVDDAAYPPQKKSFMMLRHMYDHHINDYDWFLRVDDDVYVDYERLSTLLNSLNSSMPLFFGTPGFGIDEDDGMEEGNQNKSVILYICQQTTNKWIKCAISFTFPLYF